MYTPTPTHARSPAQGLLILEIYWGNIYGIQNYFYTMVEKPNSIKYDAVGCEDWLRKHGSFIRPTKLNYMLALLATITKPLMTAFSVVRSS